MKKCFLLFLFISFFFTASSQQIINGKITGPASVPLSNVSVTVTKINDSKIIAFAITDKNGEYVLKINEKFDSMKLKASIIGYQNGEAILTKKYEEYNFQLKQHEIKLKEVRVKNPSIYQRRDTINYSVDAFTLKQDRVIGDVISRLPGIEIKGDGTIYYQGKPIQKYFINGLDLLEGRYSLANNNLPADAVRDVQIIENDQPIKILDSLVFSDRASLNLRLKKFVTTGFAKVGMGASPLIWDVNITPMTFNKNLQTLNSLQINNVGKDVTKDLQTLTTDDLFSPSNKHGTALLSIQPLAKPPFEQQWWLKNNVHLFSSNILKKLKSGLQLKTNLYFFNDQQMEYGKTNTTLITDNENINISEIKENSLSTNKFNGNFILEKNLASIYFKNILQVQDSWNNNIGNLINGGNKIYQNLHNHTFHLSNKLITIKVIGKQLVNINSLTSYNRSPENLLVTPGQFDSVINNKISYPRMVQQLRINNFETNNYIAFTKGFSHFTFTPRVGFQIQDQELTSGIKAFQPNGEAELNDNLKNNLSFLRTNIYMALNAQYQSDIWKINLEVPVRQQYFNIKNLMTEKNDKITRLTEEPSLNIKYKFTQLLEGTLFSSVSNSFGEVSQLYNTYILQSYRDLQKFNTTIPEMGILTNGTYFNYKNLLHSIFTSLGYNITSTKNNLLFINEVNPDGSVTLKSIVTKNLGATQSIYANISKYYSPIKTIFKIGGNVDLSNSEQIINSILNKIHSTNYNFYFTVNSNVSDFIDLIYEGKYLIQKSKLGEKSINNIHLQEHNLNINISPSKNQLISVKTKYYLNNINTQKNNAFVNILYRYTFPKNKIDVELNCNNLLNTKYFTTVYNESFLTIQNSFELRPRQFLFSVRFSF